MSRKIRRQICYEQNYRNDSFIKNAKMERTGVAVVAKDKGMRRGITLKNLKIHDVNGNVYDKHMNNGGIYMTALQPENEAVTGVARFGEILVEGCYVANVSRWIQLCA